MMNSYSPLSSPNLIISQNGDKVFDKVSSKRGKFTRKNDLYHYHLAVLIIMSLSFIIIITPLRGDNDKHDDKQIRRMIGW